MHVRSTPQSGQTRCSGGTSCRIGLRGRLAGSGLRPWPFLDALGVGVDVGTDSEVVAGVAVAWACARILERRARVEPGRSARFPTVVLPKELFELVLELFVEMNLLTKRLQQLADELMGRFQIIWQWVRDGDHTLILR